MFDQNNLEEAFALVKYKGFGKEGLVEIDITADKVTFDTGIQRIAYLKGFTREVKSEDIEEIDFSLIPQASKHTATVRKKRA